MVNCPPPCCTNFGEMNDMNECKCMVNLRGFPQTMAHWFGVGWLLLMIPKKNGEKYEG